MLASAFRMLYISNELAWSRYLCIPLRRGKGTPTRAATTINTILNMKMKKTIVVLFALAGVVSAEVVTSSLPFTGGENTYLAGSSYGSLTLSSDMTTGKSTTGAISFDPSVALMGNAAVDPFYWGASNNTVSLWVETSSLAQDTLLFGYYTNSTQAIGYYWNADTSTISFGRGTWSEGQFTYNATTEGQMENSNSLSSYISEGDPLTNITIAVDTFGGYANAKATVWVNGSKIGTTDTFYTDGNGGTLKYIVGDATYGTISLINETLTTAEQIANFAAPVPEPTTATLSLLALAGLAVRRRRK